MDWVEDTINRELRQFIVMVAKSEGLDTCVLSNLIEKPVIIQTDQIIRRKRRTPPTENRCKARLLKDGHENQCSHSASSGDLCKIHVRGDLKYGQINDEIPLDHRYKFKYKICEEDICEYDGSSDGEDDNEQEKYRVNFNNFDLSLYPTCIDNLIPIKIGGGHYLNDSASNCVYLKKNSELFYVGKLKDNHISRF